MPPKTSEFDQEMSRLEADLKRLEAEYNMFFAGRLPRLPWETRARVEAMIRRYDRIHIRNTAEKFRFGSLQARFVKFCELWERNLRAREEGRAVGGRRSSRASVDPKGPAAAAPTRAREAPPQPRAGVVAETALRDPAAEADRLRELYDRLSTARQTIGEKPIPFEAFRQVVRAQVNKLGGGDTEVAFRVTVEGGKVKLKAKALKGSE